jgi:hypothetical protein
MTLSSVPGLSHPYHNFTGKLEISATIRHKEMLIAQVLDYFLERSKIAEKFISRRFSGDIRK